ncbi:hypothetical protein GOP47_0011928 [Adiantum capillus-veneris]|uniref:Uncharacterized protein n=1 Tax=Adiantum capillus-veneris TaxID=13818 RepID=A0A9D4ZI53_ADICA|nr:hypothetical protein GOP47_0011928 [Adiantum capillus-veneris]
MGRGPRARPCKGETGIPLTSQPCILYPFSLKLAKDCCASSIEDGLFSFASCTFETLQSEVEHSLDLKQHVKEMLMRYTEVSIQYTAVWEALWEVSKRWIDCFYCHPNFFCCAYHEDVLVCNDRLTIRKNMFMQAV